MQEIVSRCLRVDAVTASNYSQCHCARGGGTGGGVLVECKARRPSFIVSVASRRRLVELTDLSARHNALPTTLINTRSLTDYIDARCNTVLHCHAMPL